MMAEWKDADCEHLMAEAKVCLKAMQWVPATTLI
jgi:hypothetical protein